jgi:hypothetical protein
VRRLIFLDIDGVMNVAAWKKTEALGESAIVRHSHMTRRESLIEDNPCEPHLSVLNEISRRVPGCELVISSTWRHEMDRFGWDRFFSTLGCEIPVTGKTDRSIGNRGTEILLYLVDQLGGEINDERNGRESNPIEGFVVLDDDGDSDWDIVADRWILIDNDRGLTMADVDPIVCSLEKKLKFPIGVLRWWER